jgi:hypothetical protein
MPDKEKNFLHFSAKVKFFFMFLLGRRNMKMNKKHKKEGMEMSDGLKLLGIQEVCRIMHFSKSKVYQMVKDKAFPSGLSDGWRRLWLEPEIRAFSALYWNTGENMPEGLSQQSQKELHLCLERWKQQRRRNYVRERESI